MSRRRERRLTEEERRLWSRVAASARPMRAGNGAGPLEGLPESLAPRELEPPRAAVLPGAVPDTPERVERLEPFRIGEKAQTWATTAAEPRREEATISLDRRSLRRLARGKTAPEARIDLHGMTLDEAHEALTRFILSAQARGLRLVLVITGKGSGCEEPPFPYRRGILRRQVPVWLRTGPMALAVAEVGTAHRRHGGEGALYVRLRKTPRR
jgi:DNA-nicking Smr family endonuclease